MPSFQREALFLSVVDQFFRIPVDDSSAMIYFLPLLVASLLSSGVDDAAFAPRVYLNTFGLF